jgi:glycine/D-amino acid oxidase-like deaminating enzyme
MGRVGVIGAGIVGLAAARALQRDGHDVTVFDRREPGAGCSFGNAGHIALDHIRPLARPDVLLSLPRLLFDPLGPLCLKPAGLPRLLPWMLRFAAASVPHRVAAGTAALAALLTQASAAWADEIAASQLAPLFRHQGSLQIYERDIAAGAAEAKILTAHGVRVEMLPAAEAARRVPGLAVAIAGGRWLPEASHSVDPRGVVVALAERLTAEGGRFKWYEVTGFEIDDGKVRAVLSGERRWAVDHIVLAAGAGAASLARQLGVVAPLTCERGYHLMLQPAVFDLAIPVTFAERGFVMTPMTAGIRLAGTVELGAGAKPDWRRAEQLARHARQLFGRPDLSEASRWHGDRPTLPDYLPMVGPAPRVANAVLALGHQHLGLTLAAVTGALVAALIAGRTPAVPLEAFRADRFGTIKKH